MGFSKCDANRTYRDHENSVSCPVQSAPKSNSRMYSMSMFLTLFFLIIFNFPGIERTDRNDLIQNAGADATGDLHEPTSVSEINMVMD